MNIVKPKLTRGILLHFSNLHEKILIEPAITYGAVVAFDVGLAVRTAGSA